MRRITLLTFFCIVVLSGCGSPEERAAAYLEDAQESFDKGDYVTAKLEVQNAAQIEPKNAEARYLLALIAEQDGNARAMLLHLEVVVEEDPQMVKARVKLGALYVFAQAYELALEQLIVAEKLAPGDPDVVVLSALLWLRQGDVEQSLAKLDLALEIDPTHVEAIAMKTVALEASEPDRALDILEEAIGRLPADDIRSLQNLQLDILERQDRTREFEQALLAMIADPANEGSIHRARLARFYWDQGQLDEAEGMLRDIATAASRNVGAQLNVVRFLLESRTSEAAIESLQEFVDADPENQRLMLALGDLYLDNDQHDEAVKVYAAAAELDPLSVDGLLARVKLAADLIRKEDIDGARALVATILTDDPAFPRALLIRAGLFYSEQHYGEAIADLRILLRNEENNQRALLLMARSEIALDNIVLAKDAYRRLLGVNPGHVVATQELVALMVQAGQFDEAADLLARLTKNGSGSIEAGMLKIQLLVMQEDWEAASAEAERYASGANTNGAGTYMLGQVLEGQQRYGEAANAFSQALEINPSSVPILQGLARSLNAQGKEDEVIALLRQSVADYPDNPGIRLMMGGALMEQGQTTEALQIFESVISDYPELSPGYVAVASLYPDDATKRIAVYRRGLEALPANLALGKLLADEYQYLGRVDDLFVLYDELITAHPKEQNIANNLAAMLADLRYQDPASLARAVELADGLADTDDAAILDTIGWVYYRSGDSDRAVRYLERATATLGEIPVVRYHLGMAYLAAGNRIGAKQELETAIQSTKGDFVGIKVARETLATLE
jgi:tetratricopeptide (TPR) repeat protein